MASVLLFGRLRDLAGWREKVFDGAHTVVELRALIRQADANLADALDRPGVQAAVDRVLTRGDVALAPNAEVAFMPPMSGG